MTHETLAELVRFTPEAYGFRYQNYVTVFIPTDEGVILIDPIGQGNARTPHLIREAVRSVTDKPVRYVVYSHSALDHATGGAAFADTARFVGHARCVERLKAANDPTTPPPDITFDQTYTLELGGRRLDLYPADLSGGDDYIVVHDAPGRLAMFVDLAQPRNVPFRMLLGHPDRVIERLKWVEDNLDFDVLISGHAQPQVSGTKQDVTDARRYMEDLSDAVATARAAGLADGSGEMKTMVRALLQGRYGAWRRFEDFVGLNVEGLISWRAGNSHYPQ